MYVSYNLKRRYIQRQEEGFAHHNFEDDDHVTCLYSSGRRDAGIRPDAGDFNAADTHTSLRIMQWAPVSQPD